MNSAARSTRDALSLPETVKYLISAAILLVSAGIMIGLYTMRDTNEKSAESDALIPLVDTTSAGPFEGEIDLEVAGTVVPYREIRLGAELSGVISKKHPECEAGNFVKSGSVLLEIDPRDYKLEVKTLQSEMLQATRTMDETDEEIRGAIKNLEIAKSDLKLQEREFRRTEKLSNSIAANEMDQARRALLNSESQLTLRQNTYEMLLKKKERLKSSLELIDNRMDRAKLNLERTLIKAPTDGVIVRENVEQGDFVTVGRDLLLFECTSGVEVLCNLTPGELAWIREYSNFESQPESPQQIYSLPKLEVKLFEQSNPSVKWTGTLERFDGIGLTETTKSIPCRIVVNEPIIKTRTGERRVLVRGMYLKCQMVLPVNQLEQLVAFPASGLRPGDYVWAVRDEKLHRFEVSVVDRSPPKRSYAELDMVVIDLTESGMVSGEKIVTSPLPQPINGGRVILRNPSEQNSTNSSVPTTTTVDSEKPAIQKTETRTTKREEEKDFDKRSKP